MSSRCFARLTASVLVLLLSAAFAAAPAATPVEPNAPYYDSDMQTAMTKWVNAQREVAGLPSLELDDRLTASAMMHVAEVVKHNDTASQFPGEATLQERFIQVSVRANPIGENVGFGKDLASIQQDALKSDIQKNNILSTKYNAYGVAVMRSSDAVYVVADFAHRLSSETTADVDGVIAAAMDASRHARNLMPMKRANLSYLSDAACKMAKQDKLDGKLVPPAYNGNTGNGGSGSAGYVDGAKQKTIVFTTNTPDVIPESVLKLEAEPTFNVYSVGSCFAKTQSYPEGIYWVAMTFYYRQQAEIGK